MVPTEHLTSFALAEKKCTQRKTELVEMAIRKRVDGIWPGGSRRGRLEAEEKAFPCLVRKRDTRVESLN